MIVLFALVGLVLIVVLGLVVLGRETARLSSAVRPAVLDLGEAVEVIADALPEASQARLTHDDVRWVLLADADTLESVAGTGEVDEDTAVARILEGADASGREIADEDIVAILDARTEYLKAIGAIGPEVGDGDGPEVGDGDGPEVGDGDGPEVGDGDGPEVGDGDGPEVPAGAEPEGSP